VEAGFPGTHAVAVPVAREEGTRFILFLAPRDDRPIDVAEIRATCQRELPSYKLPLHFEVLDALPLTSGLKVDRAALSRLAPRIPRPVA
jgi:long-chain acyl-CoA synthetase